MTKKWTAKIKWPNGTSEEIDVDAPSERAAWAKVEAELESDYDPGGKIVSLEPFGGMTVYQ